MNKFSMKKIILILILIVIFVIGGFLVRGLNKKVETSTVKAYFNNSRLDPEFSCNKVFPVEREIPKTKAVARAVLEELLKGSSDTKKKGIFYQYQPGG